MIGDDFVGLSLQAQKSVENLKDNQAENLCALARVLLYICRLPMMRGRGWSFLNSPCLQEQGEKTYGKLSLNEYLRVLPRFVTLYLLASFSPKVLL